MSFITADGYFSLDALLWKLALYAAYVHDGKREVYLLTLTYFFFSVVKRRSKGENMQHFSVRFKKTGPLSSGVGEVRM